MIDMHRRTAPLVRNTRNIPPKALLASLLIVLLGTAASARAQAPGASRPGGPGDGIKVIGEWTIVIRDESGRELRRSEFRNALESQGKATLADLLSRRRAISEWAVLLSNGSLALANGDQPCGTGAERKS